MSAQAKKYQKIPPDTLKKASGIWQRGSGSATRRPGTSDQALRALPHNRKHNSSARRAQGAEFLTAPGSPSSPFPSGDLTFQTPPPAVKSRNSVEKLFHPFQAPLGGSPRSRSVPMRAKATRPALPRELGYPPTAFIKHAQPHPAHTLLKIVISRRRILKKYNARGEMLPFGNALVVSSFVAAPWSWHAAPMGARAVWPPWGRAPGTTGTALGQAAARQPACPRLTAKLDIFLVENRWLFIKKKQEKLDFKYKRNFPLLLIAATMEKERAEGNGR